jgi:fermentation-respiration switch protein FrsA (DUF1100 family)
MVWFWIGLGLLSVVLSAVISITLVCYRQMFYSPTRRVLREDEIAIPEGAIYEAFREDMIGWTKMIRAYPYKEYAIQSFDGLTLRAKFFEYEPNAPIELMFHGYRGCAERDLNGGVERCFQLGHSALLIDHRAAGFSDGHIISFGILERRDCLAWVDFAVPEFGEDARLILTGISMGAATVMMAARQPLPPQVKYVLADCGYTSPREIISKVMTDLHLPPPLIYPFARLAARLFGHFDLDETSPIEAMATATVPVVFAHGDTDDFVPYDMSARLYEACASEHKKLITIRGAGHGLAFPVGRESYVDALREFKRDCGFDF